MTQKPETRGRKPGKVTDTITPSLRVDRAQWMELKERYPKGVNRLFREFVTQMLQN